MYLELGNGKFIDSGDVVALLDLDITSQSYLTRNYLTLSEKMGRVINAADDIPKSFAVSKNRDIYLSQMNTATIIKRAEEENLK